MSPRGAALALLFTSLVGFFPAATPERSSSERSPVDPELLRDAPLYPPLRDTLDTEPPLSQNLEHDRTLGTPKPLQKDKETNTLPKETESSETTTLRPEENPNTPNTLPDDADRSVETPNTLPKDVESDSELKFNFEPFFDTNNDEDSVEVIQTDPETSIEDSSILVTPEEAVLPEYKIDKHKETVDKDKEIEKDIDRINENALPSNNEILTDDKVDITDGNILDFEPSSRVDDLLAKVEVEEDEYRVREIKISDEVMKEILGANEGAAEREKRSAGQDWDQSKTRRIKTGDTILNIRGAVRDAIGDAGAAPGPRASSRVDAFVIRPAPAPAPLLSDEPREQLRENKRPAPQRTERELLVEPHARARLPCDLENVTNVRWYKDNEQMSLPPSPSGGEAVWRDGDALSLARATRHHAGRWRCAGRDRAGRAVSGEPTAVVIYEPVRSVYLAVDGRRLDAGNTWVPVRDRADLAVRCVAEGGVPPPSLTWRVLALEPALDHKPYLRINPTNHSIEGVSWSRVSLTAARELHNATLQCTARQRAPEQRQAPPLTAKLEIHVTYPPSFVISRWPGFGVALWAGGAAALRCDVDANPPARAAWTRHDTHSSLAGVEEGGAGEATLRWAALRAAHAGWYRCRARWADTDYYSIGYYLNVLASEEPSPSPAPEEPPPDHQKVEVPLGGNVQLQCPKGSVGCWWRRVVGNASDVWAPTGSQHAHGVLGIKEAVYEEGGEYRCVGARAPDLQRLRELKRVTLAVTGGATATAVSAEPIAGGWRLVCGACGRGLRVLWLRGGRAAPAALAPDLAQHCWRAVLAVHEPDEVWCVVAAASGGAVAVFPRRASPSPSPARHAVRALHSGTAGMSQASAALAALCCLWLI